jgi:hypothetical protein
MGRSHDADAGHHERALSKFNHQDFPSLKMTRHLKQRKKKYGPPFDSANWYFKYSARRDDFPFDQMSNDALKIKFIPIWLDWKSNREKKEEDEVEGSSRIKPIRRGQFRDTRWFRPPPKVRVVPGIQGPHLPQATRVAHRGSGEREVTNGAEAGHRPPSPSPGDPVEVDGQNPPISFSSSDSSLTKTLAKFVKHMWRGASP